jgi:hypothetical protein
MTLGSTRRVWTSLGTIHPVQQKFGPNWHRTTGTRNGLFSSFFRRSSYDKAWNAGESAITGPSPSSSWRRGIVSSIRDDNNELRFAWQQTFAMTVHASHLGMGSGNGRKKSYCRWIIISSSPKHCYSVIFGGIKYVYFHPTCYCRWWSPMTFPVRRIRWAIRVCLTIRGVLNLCVGFISFWKLAEVRSAYLIILLIVFGW